MFLLPSTPRHNCYFVGFRGGTGVGCCTWAGGVGANRSTSRASCTCNVFGAVLGGLAGGGEGGSFLGGARAIFTVSLPPRTISTWMRLPISVHSLVGACAGAGHGVVAGFCGGGTTLGACRPLVKSLGTTTFWVSPASLM